MIVYNLSKNAVLAHQLKVARNVWERFRGLLGSKELEEGSGFLIPSCQGIHTFGMTFAIDVVYLDAEDRVIDLCENLKPNFFGPVHFHSKAVIELPPGTLYRTQTQLGDVLVLDDLPSSWLSKPISVEGSILNCFGNMLFS